MSAMKHNVFFYGAAALMMLAACARETLPQEEIVVVPGPTTFSVTMEGDPDTKAILDLNGSGHPQNFWENGDAISIFTSADNDPETKKQSGKSYRFETTLLANSTSAEFTLAEAKEFGSGMYFASYPYRNNTRGVNYSGSEGTYKMAGNQIPNAQTLVAGSFDKNAILAVAFSDGGSTLEFKNATALFKFRVSESDIVGGRIEVDAADAISGTFRADVTTDTKELSLASYTGQATYNYVDFTIDGSTHLSTGTDYYVVVCPTALTSDLKIYLNGKLVKLINNSTLASIERNKIYNLGTLTTPTTPAEVVLPFDFSGTALTGWPTTDNWQTGPGELDCTYPLYGTDYHFFLTDCGNASKARVAWVSGSGGLILYTTWRYVGLPAIAGYKLVKVQGTMCLGTKDTRKAAIVKNVVADNTAGTIAAQHQFVTGGEAMGWTTKGETYTFNLSGTEANTSYYFLCYNTSVGFSKLILTYVPS